jgi:hypothetical protein
MELESSAVDGAVPDAAAEEEEEEELVWATRMEDAAGGACVAEAAADVRQLLSALHAP